jgi:hypothetical protein
LFGLDFCLSPDNAPFVELGAETQAEQAISNSTSNSTSEILLNWRYWQKIDTTVEVKEIRGDRALIRVPGKVRSEWVPLVELSDRAPGAQISPEGENPQRQT